jgi:hypothetical protein
MILVLASFSFINPEPIHTFSLLPVQGIALADEDKSPI